MHVKPTKLSEDSFSEIAKITLRESGLQLMPEKQLMVQSRLRSRLTDLGLSSFETYIRHLKDQDGKSEIRNMISALTTNVTHFFREDHHFDLLFRRLRDRIAQRIQNSEPIRIWSAGCSTGQEPYSIVMYLLDTFPDLNDADFRVLATDIDPNALTIAKQATYRKNDLHTVPTKLKNLYLRHDNDLETYKIHKAIKSFIAFKELNLMQTWPMSGKFDAVFCRNVVIYFNVKTQSSLWPRFADILHPHGLLFLGHSERISNPERYGLNSVGTTCYEKRPNSEQNVAFG